MEIYRSAYKTFAGFIYAAETEEAAVMYMYDWKEKYIDGDDQKYYIAETERE